MFSEGILRMKIEYHDLDRQADATDLEAMPPKHVLDSAKRNVDQSLLQHRYS